MPPLPTELWWYILRYAVDIPCLFETKWDYSPDSLIWYGWDSPRSGFSDSLQTKLSICLVSKIWRKIGVELLYEHLYFTDNGVIRIDDIPKLVTIFEQHAGQSGYGRSTKRVDIDGFYSYHAQWFPPILRLLELCYNIRIFNFPAVSVNAEQTAKLSSLLQNRFSHSLRRMKLILYDFNATHYLPNLPLEALELSIGNTLAADPPPLVTTVTTLSLSQIGYQAELLWRFPSLRHLSFRDVSDNYILLLEPFMTAHGPQLHSLHLAFEENEYVTHLPKLLSPATNLRCLALSLFSGEWPQPGDSFPNITHIALQTYPASMASDIEMVVEQSIFPDLQCIRLLDDSDHLSDPVNKEAWMSLLEAGSQRNIQFEDNDCQLLEL